MGERRLAARPAARRARAPAPSSPPVRVTGSALLDVPLAKSGVPGARVLGRVGKRMGLATVRDLLFHLPRRYDDLREMRKLGELRSVDDGTVISARVTVADVRVEASFRRHVQRTIAVLEDETGTIQATWFGRRYIERRMHPGQRVIVSGKLKHFGRTRTLDNPDFQPEGNEDELLHVGRIVPVYRLTAGLTAVTLRRAVRDALDRAGSAFLDYLPPAIVRERGVAPLTGALEEAHYPTSFEKRDAALERLAFDELLALQLGMVARRRGRTHERGGPVPVADADDTRIRAAIVDALRAKVGPEVELTHDQATAIDAINDDLARPTPMLRLLQGDVGSGKTAVAAWALAAVALAGHQAAILAPTDLLARQHHRTLNDLLAPLGLPIELLTGSLRGGDAARVRERLATGMAPIVVGTHALISESVAFADLALAVIDEQHRFGVEQRSALEAKAGGRVPHLLLMTATPIPRTLGQVLYADLDVTDLRTPPEGRVRIRTGIREPGALDSTWQKVRDEAALGHRTFVVVPLIVPGDATEADEDEDPETLGFEASPASSAVAAEPEAERLRELLAPLRVGLVHGRLKPADRDAEMARFRDGELDVLVGTTVVEVGVDVPEATMMIVEGADRFGLAQLHQLRGRVGRGTVESFCVLVSEATDPTAKARLEAARDLRDGFELAERDWELRREGDVLGLVQSGLPRLRIASLQREGHRELAAAARAAAEALLDDAGRLRPGHEALARELASGWLARVAQAEPAGAA
ncbi:MAG: ATP-dependent DNA helicase RecG [Chloroflexi bacterium]|nr:ATP-dependent DNA helicase RecG [Chloroflexota bacterium]